MSDFLRHLTLLLCAVALPVMAASVPNPSFDEAAADGPQPLGWSLASGDGDWRVVDGDRSLTTTGDDRRTSFWASDSVAFEPGAAYRLRFSARRVEGGGGGTVMSGTAFANRDLGQLDTSWRRISSYFVAPDSLVGRAWLRFGQWQLPGTIAFDDIRLDRVQPVHRDLGGGLRLGAGEQIAAGRYTFRAPQRTEMANHSRPLLRHTTGFNSYRWLFDAGQVVHYRFDLGRHRQSAGRVAVNVNYHTGGRLILEARGDSVGAWQRLGVVEGARSDSFAVPVGAILVELRLRAEAPAAGAAADGTNPGSFQVDEVRYAARLDGDPPEGEGRTRLVATPAVTPRAGGAGPVPSARRPAGSARDAERSAAVPRLVDVGAMLPGVVDTLTIELGRGWPTTVRARVQVTDSVSATPGVSAAASRSDEPEPGVVEAVDGRLRLPYRLTGTGERVLHVELAGSDGLLWRAEIDTRISVLHADDYGGFLGHRDGVDLWTASSGWKVSTTRQVPRAPATAVRLELARNEAEAVQLVLRPSTPLRGLTARATDLVRADGAPAAARIAAAHVEVLRVGTVPVRTPTDVAGEVGDWPDPLLPLDSTLGGVSAAADRNLALWVRVTTPTDLPAGLYRGQVQLRAEGWQASVPLEVTVWEVTLPDRMTLQTAFGFSPGAVWEYHRLEEDADRRRVLDLYLDSFARHHISPYDPAPLDRPVIEWPDLAGRPVEEGEVIEPTVDWARWDAAMQQGIEARHFNSFRLAIPGMGGGTYIDRREPVLQGWPAESPQYRALFRGYGRALERHLRQKGWLDEAYVYWFDEPAPRDYDFVMDGFARLRDAAPGVTRMLTEQVEPELLGGPTLWCPVTPNFDAADAAARRAAGERFWWYVCTVPKTPYAGLFIDHPGTELRVWLWQTWERRIDGILVWATNYWTSGAAYPGQRQNPYEDPMSWESAYNAPVGTRRPWGNGDGRFVYPPPAVFEAGGPVLEGPVETIRWEMLRDGIEDVEYLWMLQRALATKADRLSADERAAWTSLLDVPQAISASMTSFTEDPAPIEAHRRAVARALEQLARR
jgi:hypothetical protein